MMGLELETILQAISIDSPASFSCLGDHFETKPEHLIASVTDFLYRECYIVKFRDGQARSGAGEDLIDELRGAHPGGPCRDAGWRIEQVLASGEIVARKSGSARRVKPGEYLLVERQFGPLEPGQRVAICLPRDSIAVQEQYYFVFGDTASEHEDGYNQIRFYWNIAVEQAAPVVAAVTRAFNRFQVPFQLKCMRHRERYYRRDAAVLYVNKKHYTIAAMLAAEVHAQISDAIGDDTPLFTKKLARGLGFAEDPGESFGKSRCRIVAHALWSSYEQSLDSDKLLEEVEGKFQELGLTLARPYLNAGSADCYEFPVLCS